MPASGLETSGVLEPVQATAVASRLPVEWNQFCCEGEVDQRAAMSVMVSAGHVLAVTMLVEPPTDFRYSTAANSSPPRSDRSATDATS